jgi:hypothetical protein
MKWRMLGYLVLVTFWLGGCAGGDLMGTSPGPQVGQGKAELVAQKGQPQQILPGPQGGQIYVYQRTRMDHMASMGGGAWGKPEDIYYSLDSKGVIYKVTYYPYGKRKFIFPTEKEPGTEVRTAATSSQPVATPSPAPVAPPREKVATPKAAPIPTPVPSPTTAAPPASSPQGSMALSTRLELRMTKGEVQRLLGTPDRTEGFLMGDKGVVIWFYSLQDRRGRLVKTPLVFKGGRLVGWGEAYYQRIMREAGSRQP